MSKRLLIMVSVALAALWILGSLALAMEADGNSRKGKFLYRKYCKTCHSEGGEAKGLGPDAKTQAEWTAAFEPAAVDALACKAEWAKPSEKDMKDIYTFLYKGAYDSPNPVGCK